MNRIFNKLQRILKRILVLLLVLLVLSSGSWVADGVKGEVLFLDWFGSWGLLVAFGIFLTASGLLYRLRRTFANIQSLSWHKCDPHKSLILIVSPPTPETWLDDSRTLHFSEEEGKKVQLKLSDNLHDDIKKLDCSSCRWNWQQIMRAIQPHIDPEKRLRRLHLIGSTDGSVEHLDSCKKWLEGYLSGVEITKDESGVDFGNFNAMVRHIQKIIDEQKKGGKGKVKFTDKDIVIDVTGEPPRPASRVPAPP